MFSNQKTSRRRRPTPRFKKQQRPSASLLTYFGSLMVSSLISSCWKRMGMLFDGLEPALVPSSDLFRKAVEGFSELVDGDNFLLLPTA